MQIPSECRGSMWKWVGDFLSLLLLLPSLTRLISYYPLPGSVLACIMVPKFIFEAPQSGCFFLFSSKRNLHSFRANAFITLPTARLFRKRLCVCSIEWNNYMMVQFFPPSALVEINEETDIQKHTLVPKHTLALGLNASFRRRAFGKRQYFLQRARKCNRWHVRESSASSFSRGQRLHSILLEPLLRAGSVNVSCRWADIGK